MTKQEKIEIRKSIIRYAIYVLILVAIVVSIFCFCDIHSSAEDEAKVNGTTLDTANMYQYTSSYLDNGTEDYTDDILDYDNYKIAYNSDNYQLLYHEKDASIIVRDKNSEGYVENDYSTGYMWTSTVDTSKKDLEKVEAVWRRKISSLIIPYAYDANNNKAAIDTPFYLEGDYVHTDGTMKYDPAKMSIKPIEGKGIEVTFAYETAYLQLSVRIFMEDDILHVEIPKDSIVEQGNWRLTKVDILPMFGCVENDQTSGYVFYPDGSGAISYFNEENVRETGTSYMWRIYSESPGEKPKIGEETTRLNYTDLIQNKESGVKSVSLPVFGIREDDDHALFGIIDKGSADCAITYVPSGYVVPINCIYNTVSYRRAMDLKAIGGYGIAANSSQKNADSAKYETNIEAKDISVLYNFLGTGEANYSGMAKTYREYLIENNLITDVITDNIMQVGVDLFMGIYEEQTLADAYVAMTTYEQAESILSDLNTELGSNVKITSALYGWQSGGYGADPLAAKAASGLGGTAGLKALTKKAQELNVTLALNVNPVDMYSGDFTARTDAVYLATNLPMVSQNGYARNYKSMFEDYLPAYVSYAKELGVSLNIEQLGWLIYNDYSKSGMNRTDAYAYIMEQLNAIKADGVNYWAESNRYTLSGTSRITDLAYTHSQYDISNEAVPFYQMVIHGYIPYSSAPGNLSHDLAWLELKWAEFGYMPYFLFSEEDAADMKYTEANWLYSCKYADWKESAMGVMKRMAERTSCVWNDTIVGHERLDKFLEVYATYYESGHAVFVNYTDSDYTSTYTTTSGSTATVTIPAMDYVVVDNYQG